MDHTLNRLALGKAGPVLLLAISPQHVSGVLAIRERDGWTLASEVVLSEIGGLDGIGTVIDALKPPKQTKFALVATSECETLLHQAEVPAHLNAKSGAELLRWEIDLSHVGEDTGTEPALDPSMWELGYTPAGSGQTAVAAIPRPWLAALRERLEAHSLRLAATLPALSLGWRSLPPSGSHALVLKWHERISLSVFEGTRPEFYAAYPAPVLGWPRGLIADARSFALEHLYALGEDSGEFSGMAPDPALPAVETLVTGEEWLWTGLLETLNACASDHPLSIPLIDEFGETLPSWKRPRTWWGAAAAALLAVALPLAFVWNKQITTLRLQNEQTSQKLSNIILRLQAFEAETEAYTLLETELNELEHRIAKAAELRERPAAAPCARVAYVADALGALARSFSRNVRVSRFQTDFEGHISINGEADQDSSVQDALGNFYALLAQHPVLPAPLSTTREGSRYGRLSFLAQHNAFHKLPDEPTNSALEAELRNGGEQKATVSGVGEAVNEEPSRPSAPSPEVFDERAIAIPPTTTAKS